MIVYFIGIALAGLLAVFLLSKCFFLAPYRGGWLMLVANLVYEVAERKLRCSRTLLDALLLLVLVIGIWLLSGSVVSIGVVLFLIFFWGWSLIVDAKWRSGSLGRQYAPLKQSVPLPVPQLIVTLRGPVLERRRGCYELGDWPEGLEQKFEVMVLNPSIVRPQLTLTVTMEVVGECIRLDGVSNGAMACPEPGEVKILPFRLKALRSGSGGAVNITVTHGDFVSKHRLHLRQTLSPGSIKVKSATIKRWKHGASGAFVWRGDQDLYDPSTFQSEEGLRVTLGLAGRFRMPSSLMLSARLSLVPEVHKAFCEHFGWDRKTEEIPEFIRFLRDDVDTSVEQEWPTATYRPFAVEIGNHHYLHYGTHVAADPGNGWKSHARMGEGEYSWLSRSPADSFSEQRDNALKCNAVFLETIGVVPASFTIPSDVHDMDTARAIEAAGLEVGSETDAGKLEKLLWLSPPHHPEGCSRFVELPRMHPRDPENACQLAIMKYWVGVARRTGRSLVFLAHHHLMRYRGNVSYHLVEELLRYVLAEQDGDLYVATLTSVGRYWRDVLSERTRCLDIRVDGQAVRIANNGARDLSGLPLDIDMGEGRSFMCLVDVNAHEVLKLQVVESRD